MRKIIPAVAAGVTALAVAGGTFGYVTLDKAVSLSIDGDVSQVQTMAPTVGELLEKQGIAGGRARRGRSRTATPGSPRAPRSP